MVSWSLLSWTRATDLLVALLEILGMHAQSCFHGEWGVFLRHFIIFMVHGFIEKMGVFSSQLYFLHNFIVNHNK